MNNNESANFFDDFDGATWEEELDIVLPKSEANIIVSQQIIQHQIALHKTVDRGTNWGDVRILLPQTRLAKSDSRIAKNTFIGPKVPRFYFYPFSAYYAKKILATFIGLLGLVFKLVIFLILTLLGDKKARKKMWPKSRVLRKRSPRRNRNTKKAPRKKPNEALVVSQALPTKSWKPINSSFVPSSNLYCYWCAKKLGLKSWESNGRYYCEGCYILKK